jgi:hypothetical protein
VRSPPGTENDQYLSFRNDQPSGTFNPRAGTYSLTGFHVMFAAGCGYFEGKYQWHPQQPELYLTLPTQGERGPRIEGGRKLHWIGERTLSTSVFDTKYSAVWTYDLTYDPGGTAGCRLNVKNPQRATASGLLLTVVAPAGRGCTAKLKGWTLNIGTQKYRFFRKPPQRKIAAGKSWKPALPYGAPALRAIRKALQRRTSVSTTVEFDIDGTTRTGTARLN